MGKEFTPSDGVKWAGIALIAGLAYYGFVSEMKADKEPAPKRKNPRSRRGKYRDVMVVHGRDGFAIPELMPKQGSFPLYPIKRARYALTVVASPAYDTHPEVRKRVIAAVLREHPELKAHAASVRRAVAKRSRR
jgi:hypothetical protein